MTTKTINPSTGEVIASYPEMNQVQVNSIIDSVNCAYLDWKLTNFATRASLLTRVAEVLMSQQQALATLMAEEMGKPVTSGRAEIEKCAALCRHYAKHAERYLASREVETEYHKSYVSYRPLGIVFAIMPWNFPVWQVMRFICPTLMAGNVGILKHAAISTGTSLAIEHVFNEAGCPPNVFRSLVIDNDVAAEVIANPHIKAVTLTGSERAGSIVGANAAKHLKQVVLELGGSDPYIVLDDADLSLAAEQITLSRMNNTGQVCIAAKRIIATPATLSKLQPLILEKMQSYTMQSPLLDTCRFGPMAREDLRSELHQQVISSIEAGAKLLMGGVIPDGPGFYYPATALSNVGPGMPAYDAELFGPVMCFLEAKDELDAIRIANDSPYGLAAAVFTSDLLRGQQIAEYELEAGACFVNGLVSSDPRLPFGGIKLSGYGRELSAEGIRAFVNVKTVVVKSD